MKKILVTGGKGFFGSRFYQHYKDRYDIILTDKEDTDLTDYTAVKALLGHVKPDVLIHAAAIPVTDFCNQNPELAHKINVESVQYVAEAAKKIGTQLVLLSTEQVFNGNSEPGPYQETDTPLPDTVYGENKVEAEKLVGQILEDYWILRFTWLFGLPERGCAINPNVLWNTVQAALRGTPTQVSDEEYRGFTYVYDVIDQFEKLFALPSGLYHVGSRNDLSRYQVSCEILRAMGLGSRIEELLIPKAGAYRDDRLNTNKIQSMGFHFDDSVTAIQKCLKEFMLTI